MTKTYLLIGGNGFVGYQVLRRLASEGKKIRCIDQAQPEREMMIDGVEYRIGDVQEKAFLEEALIGIDTVLDFVSTTMPNTKDISLENEINNTLRYHNYILSTMVDVGVNSYVFPSSGGAVYGSRQSEIAVETDTLFPTTPYGAGKKIVEDIIHYYGHKCGLNAIILRIGNVYGSNRMRKKPQGVIDVFIQNALEGKPIVIWGNADNAVRDYVYLEDVAESVNMVLERGLKGINTYNIGTGIGTSVNQIIQMIEQITGIELAKEKRDNKSSGVDRIVLSNKKIYAEVGWKPKVELREGIKKTVEFKKSILQR